MIFPLNRVIAFAGPYISIAGGGVATWIVAKLNLIGVAGLDQADLAQQVAGALTFTLTAGLSWLGQAQWLKGHHTQMASDAAVQAAALAAPQQRQSDVPPDPAHDALIALGEDLPDDEEEFGTPPGQDGRVTPEPPPAPRFQPEPPAPQFAAAPPQQFGAEQPVPQFAAAQQFAAAPPAQQFAAAPPAQQFAAPPPAPQFVTSPQVGAVPQFVTAPPQFATDLPQPEPPSTPGFPA